MMIKLLVFNTAKHSFIWQDLKFLNNIRAAEFSVVLFFFLVTLFIDNKVPMHLVGFEPTTLLFTQFGMSFDLELIGVLIFTFYYHLSVEKSS